MAIESIAAGLGGAMPAPGGASQTSSAEAFEAFRPAPPEAPAPGPAQTARLGGPAEGSLRPRIVTEVSASPPANDLSLGQNVLDRLDTLQRGAAATALPGPPGEGGGPSFEGMMDQLRQMSGQVVQVSLVTKTTSSFTGSLNKLLSSG